MSDSIRRESPLERFNLAVRMSEARGKAGILVRERAFLTHINVRGNAVDQRFLAGVSKVVGVAPPIAANTFSELEGDTVYWLGPDEWLIVSAGKPAATLEAELRTALAGSRFAVTDVSGGQTVLVLRGARIRELLAKGCPLDLHVRAFAVGQCAQTHLAKAPILIRLQDSGPAFEIVVRRSFADYLWLWLEDAAAEYGFEVSA
jgi:sarcosine oxidase subunit gamma